jgi:hypothetical protein
MISDANRTEFEQRGPDGVRGQIAAALYDAEKQKQAYKWLDEIEHEATRSLIREQISVAADARDAAWVVARAARRANTRATIALVIASISALVAVAAVVVPHFGGPFSIPPLRDRCTRPIERQAL